ncbi:hypothetical protein C8J38_102393 [Rhizobium sp. PP-WC-2G-219]|nr:hypothetical protein C8J38_102393 [Rhizobium sp. PP-WC-2G-219]
MVVAAYPPPKLPTGIESLLHLLPQRALFVLGDVLSLCHDSAVNLCGRVGAYKTPAHLRIHAPSPISIHRLAPTRHR